MVQDLLALLEWVIALPAPLVRVPDPATNEPAVTSLENPPDPEDTPEEVDTRTVVEAPGESTRVPGVTLTWTAPGTALVPGLA